MMFGVRCLYKKTTFVRLNSKKLPFFVELRTPRVLSLYVSKDSVINTKDSFYCDAEMLFFEYSNDFKEENITQDIWKEFDKEEKKKLIINLFTKVNFLQNFDNSELQIFLRNIFM